MDFSLKGRKKEYMISEEAAFESLMELIEYYDFEVDDIENSDQKSQVTQNLKKIVRDIQSGRVEVVSSADSNAGKPYFVQNIFDGKNNESVKETIEYKGNLAKGKSATDGLSDKARHSMMYAFMGSLSGLGAGGMKALDGKDYSTMETLGSFLVILAS